MPKPSTTPKPSKAPKTPKVPGPPVFQIVPSKPATTRPGNSTSSAYPLRPSAVRKPSRRRTSGGAGTKNKTY